MEVDRLLQENVLRQGKERRGPPKARNVGRLVGLKMGHGPPMTKAKKG